MVRNLWPAMQLESAATVGVVVILIVLGIIVKTSVDAGLPAIKDGELPLWTFEVTVCSSPINQQSSSIIVTK